MKKTKLKVVSMFLLVAVLSLTGCGKKGKCDICGETKRGKTITVLGEKGFVCNDCQKGINDIFK